MAVCMCEKGRAGSEWMVAGCAAPALTTTSSGDVFRLLRRPAMSRCQALVQAKGLLGGPPSAFMGVNAHHVIAHWSVGYLPEHLETSTTG